MAVRPVRGVKYALCAGVHLFARDGPDFQEELNLLILRQGTENRQMRLPNKCRVMAVFCQTPQNVILKNTFVFIVFFMALFYDFFVPLRRCTSLAKRCLDLLNKNGIRFVIFSASGPVFTHNSSGCTDNMSHIRRRRADVRKIPRQDRPRAAESLSDFPCKVRRAQTPSAHTRLPPAYVRVSRQASWPPSACALYACGCPNRSGRHP